MHLPEILWPDLVCRTDQSGVMGLCPISLCSMLQTDFVELPTPEFVRTPLTPIYLHAASIEQVSL